MPTDPEKKLMELLSELGWILCREIHDEVRRTPVDQLAAVNRESEDDTIYAIDQEVEERVTAFFEDRVRPDMCVALVMEGTPHGALVFGGSGKKSDAEFTVLMDPLDGTRGLMYGKRSAWLLAGAAPGASPALTLKDITLAVQTEIPPAKQLLADQLWAYGGQGAFGARRNIISGEQELFRPVPSSSKKIHYGFVTFNRYFPVAKDAIVAAEMELVRRLSALGEQVFYFEDQYICSGGQLAALAMGQDRFVCDLRAIVSHALTARGFEPMLSVHPYDVGAELVAREAGVIVTGPDGKPLDAPLDTTTGITWIGYANRHIRRMIEPHLLDILENIGSFIP